MRDYYLAMDLSNLKVPLDLYPVVICQSRYSGVYEGGAWFCIPHCESIPEDAVGEDTECVDFWHSEASAHIGVGDSPNEALLMMLTKNNVLEPQHAFQEAFQKFKNRAPDSATYSYSSGEDIERTGYFKRASGFAAGQDT